MASSRGLAYLWMFFGLSSHMSLIFPNNLNFIVSDHLPSLPTSNAIPLDSISLLLRSSPALALPRSKFCLSSWIILPSITCFFFLCTFTFCIALAKCDPYTKYFFWTGPPLTVHLLLLMSLEQSLFSHFFFFLLYCFVGLFSLFNWISEFSLSASWHNQRFHLRAEQQWDSRSHFRHKARAAQKHSYGEHPTYS